MDDTPKDIVEMACEYLSMQSDPDVRTSHPLSAHGKAIIDTLVSEIEHLRDAMKPRTGEFIQGLNAEAVYQRSRWRETDPTKSDSDWYWTLGYIAGKVLWPDIPIEKRLHRIEAAAGLLANWHATIKESSDVQ